MSYPRRGPGPPNHGAPGPQQLQAQHIQAQHALHIQHQEALRRKEEAKNRSQKPVDRGLPDGLEELVVGDGVEIYNRMRDMERNLDALVMRKRLEMQETMYRDDKHYRKMRIWVWNTVENQPWQYSGMDPSAYDFSSGIEATWRVMIHGRLLEDDEDDLPPEDEAADKKTDESNAGDGERAAKRTKLSAPSAGAPRKRLSHFFKAITIDFDRNAALQPDGFSRIEWKRPENQQTGHLELPSEADFDRLEFQRKGDVNMNITINFSRDEFPERYRLDPKLADLLDMEEADRQTVLEGIWEYVKLAGVRTDDDKRQIYCDHALQKVFGTEVLVFSQLPLAIKHLLQDPAPLQMKYTIRTDKQFHNGTSQPEYTIYDVLVPAPSPLSAQIKAMSREPAHIQALRDIAHADDDIALLVQKIKQCKAKHDFCTNLSKDPARFVQRWTASQKRDLDVILGAGAWGEEDWQGAEWRKGGQEGVWGSEEAQQAVAGFLARPKGQ